MPILEYEPQNNNGNQRKSILSVVSALAQMFVFALLLGGLFFFLFYFVERVPPDNPPTSQPSSAPVRSR